MTTLGRIYRTVTGMADYGRRLPATEQLAWRALAVQLQEFADQDQEFADQEPSRPTWSPPPEGVAEGVRALHGQLVTMNTPVSALVARWVSLWLAECADQTQRRAQRAQARATAQQDPARPELLVTRRGRWGTSASRRATYRPGLQRRRVWPVLLISGATVETAVEFQCLVAVRWVATLTCAADDRPWQWRQVGSQIQVHLGPPPTLEPPSAPAERPGSAAGRQRRLGRQPCAGALLLRTYPSRADDSPVCLPGGVGVLSGRACRRG